MFLLDVGDVGSGLGWRGDITFDVDGVGSSVTDVGGGQNVCSAGSGEYAGVFGGGGLFSSPCWSSESSRNTMFR